MTLLQRKIFSEIFQVFILVLFVILALILMGRALQLRELLFGLELSLIDTVLLFVYMAPTFLQLAAPIACMISVFIVFLRLETDREMVAIRAGGVSLYQVLSAPILASILVTGLTFYLAIYGISWGMYKFRDTVIEVASDRAKIVVQPGVFNKDIPGFILYAKNVDPVSGFMSQVLVQDASTLSSGEKKNQMTTILAPEGNIDTDKGRGELLFLLKNGKIYSAQDKDSTILNFKEYIVRIPLGSVFAGLDLGPVKPKEMSLTELRALNVAEIRLKDDRLANKVVIEQHKRFIFPFSCLVLGLLAVPMASACAGVKKQQGLLIALLAFVVYYGFLSTGISMGERSGLDPYLGIWLPTSCFILLTICGIFYFNNSAGKG